MPGEVSIRISRINREFINSFGGTTHNDSMNRLVSFVVDYGPTIEEIDYITKLVTADLAGKTPDTSVIDDKMKNELLSKLHKSRNILEEREALVTEGRNHGLWLGQIQSKS